MIRRPPRSTLFPYTTSSDLYPHGDHCHTHHHSATRFVAETHRPPWPDLVPGKPSKTARLNSSHLVISYARRGRRLRVLRRSRGGCRAGVDPGVAVMPGMIGWGTGVAGMGALAGVW